jgi:hypothetical protein
MPCKHARKEHVQSKDRAALQRHSFGYGGKGPCCFKWQGPQGTFCGATPKGACYEACDPGYQQRAHQRGLRQEEGDRGSPTYFLYARPLEDAKKKPFS